MANLRPFLLITLAFLGMMIWIEWQKDYGPRPAAPESAAESASPITGANEVSADLPGAPPAVADGAVPSAEDLPATPAVGAEAEAPSAGQPVPTVEVVTDVLAVEIELVGGTVARTRLLNYPVSVDRPEEKVSLLQRGEEVFIAQSGLISRQPAPNHTSRFDVSQDRWTLDAGEERLVVPLTWRDDSGVEVTKTFVFERDSYVIGVSHQVVNRGDEAWSGAPYRQLQRAPRLHEGKAGFNNPERYSFEGAGFYSTDDKYKKLKFDDFAKKPYDHLTEGGWLAMVQHYFFAAWIPSGDGVQQFTTDVLAPGRLPHYIARAVGPQVTVPAGGSHTFESELFVGPKRQDRLPEIAPGLELTVNYGIFTVLSKPLYWLLSRIHDLVGNWGWSIVILTILIKLAFYRLTKAQYMSMARMRKLQPRIEQLKERFGDDRQKMSQAMMDLYKKEKVNPLGGCLPILVQIPIFIALYWVLIESVELRQAPFILWIDNLSVRDPFFILPALNAVFMFATQRLTPTAGMDPVQRKIMSSMPLIFAVMFAFFPAGLVLYWATNAGLSLAQQYWITKRVVGD